MPLGAEADNEKVYSSEANYGRGWLVLFVFFGDNNLKSKDIFMVKLIISYWKKNV